MRDASNTSGYLSGADALSEYMEVAPEPGPLLDGVDGWELLTYDWSPTLESATMVYGRGGEKIKVVRHQPLRAVHGVFTLRRVVARAESSQSRKQAKARAKAAS